MHKFIRVVLFVLGLFVNTISLAQAQEVEMADTMRSNGKIYIVVAVCLTILVGLFFYVFLIDRKISKIEKDL
jgi:CcmD family protein